MKKKLIAIVCSAVLVVSLATVAFAAATPAVPAAGYGFCGGSGYSLMWDADGNFLSKEAFEANLDKLIEDGSILAADKDFYLDMYDWCATSGGGATGVRGGGCGGGRGMGRGMGCGR